MIVIKNDPDKLAVSDEDMKIVWEGNRKNLFSTEFKWYEKSLSRANTVCSPHNLIDKGIVRESIGKNLFYLIIQSLINVDKNYYILQLYCYSSLKECC